MVGSNRDLIWFLVGTFSISLIAFMVMFLIPEAQSPEGLPGIPVWFVAVWSPTVMALLIAWKSGTIVDLLRRLIQFKISGSTLLLLLIPVAILVGVLLLSSKRPQWNQLPVGLLFGVIAFNLILGPLGEELGWRGLLQPALNSRFGWLISSLLIGAIWSAWHAPLWFINSPQSAIPFYIFVVHAFSYSLIMGAASILAPDSLVPAIVLHLLFNVVSGVALILESADTSQWYNWSAIPYAAGAILVSILVQTRT